MTPRANLSRSRERGSVTVFTLVTVTALFAGAGLVLDGGAATDTKAKAIGDAFGAARAGAEALARQQFAVNGSVVTDPAAARAAVLAYLARIGATGHAVTTVTGATVTVTVSLTSPTRLLDAFGLSSITVTGRGTATATYGTGGPG